MKYYNYSINLGILKITWGVVFYFFSNSRNTKFYLSLLDHWVNKYLWSTYYTMLCSTYWNITMNKTDFLNSWHHGIYILGGKVSQKKKSDIRKICKKVLSLKDKNKDKKEVQNMLRGNCISDRMTRKGLRRWYLNRSSKEVKE